MKWGESGLWSIRGEEKGRYTNLRFIFENIDEANDWCMKNNGIFIEKLMYDKAFS